MTFQEKKKETYEEIAQLEEEIVILKRNIEEFKQILEKIQTEDDIKNYIDFDIEKDLNIITLFWYWGLNNEEDIKRIIWVYTVVIMVFSNSIYYIYLLQLK